jgi:hypothetical protein
MVADIATCTEDADADGGENKSEPRHVHAHMLKRSRALRNGPRYALAAALFTLPHAFATGFGMSAISSSISHTGVTRSV